MPSKHGNPFGLSPSQIALFDAEAAKNPGFAASWENAERLARVDPTYRAIGGRQLLEQLNQSATAKAPERKAEVQAKKTADERAAITARIQAFVDSLSGGLSPDDPIVKSLRGMAVDSSQGALERSGLWGGTGGAQLTESAVQRNLLPYAQQRQGLLAQGLGLLNQRDISNQELAMRGDELAYKRAQQEWSAQQNQNAGLGSAFGTLGGALAGGILTAATAGAAAPLVPALLSGGASFGGGVGAMLTPQYRPPASVYNRPYGYGY